MIVVICEKCTSVGAVKANEDIDDGRAYESWWRDKKFWRVIAHSGLGAAACQHVHAATRAYCSQDRFTSSLSVSLPNKSQPSTAVAPLVTETILTRHRNKHKNKHRNTTPKVTARIR